MRLFGLLAVTVSVVAYAQPTASIAPDELRHVLFDQVVIAESHRDWGAGPITVEHAPSEQDTRLAMTRAIDPKRVPATMLAWRNRRLMGGGDGPRCETEITALRLLAVVEPSSELGFWNGAIDPLPARGAVLETWNSSHAWLVGELSQDCPGQTLLRAADRKVATTATSSIVSGPLRERVLAAFRSLPAYRAVQTKVGGARVWDANEEGPDPEGSDPVLRFDLPGRHLVAHIASGHVGRSDERLLAVWELSDGAPSDLKLRGIATTALLPREPFGLGTAIDLHGDGRILFTYATRTGRGALYETGDQLIDVSALRLATR